MNNNFLSYDNVIINNNFKSTNYFSNNKSNCLDNCLKNNNCYGINITNPICDKNNKFNDCVSENLPIGIDNITPDDLLKYKCENITNVNTNVNTNINTNVNTNIKTDFNVNVCKNNTANIKKEFANKINNDILNNQYYLKINDVYIGISKKLNQIYLIPAKDISSASLFKFNSNGNIIETKTNKCVQKNGDFLILQDCVYNDDDNNEQKFIYENIFNTIRPQSNTSDNNYCLTLHDPNNFFLEKCNYDNNINQAVQINKIDSINHVNLNKLDENFKANLFDDYKKINFCSNPIYKIIISLILFGILIYFIWYLTRKQYKNDEMSNDNFF